MSYEEDRRELLAPDLMARVSQIQIRTRRLVNDVLAGAYRSSFRGSGIEFDEVRPYQPGDDVRSIDWNRTAHTGETFIKTYIEERELTLMFLVDSSRSMDFGSAEFTKREIAAQFTALLAFVAQRQQDRVGLCLFGQEPGLHLPPRKGASCVARVVREVLAAPADEAGSDFEAVLELQARALRRHTLVFLISDFHGGLPEGSQTLMRVARKHEVVAVRISDPFEEQLPAAGRIALRDLESGARVELDTRSEGVRAAWETLARERRESLEQQLNREQIEIVDLSTERSVAEPVVRLFNRRRGRRAGPA